MIEEVFSKGDEIEFTFAPGTPSRRGRYVFCHESKDQSKHFVATFPYDQHSFITDVPAGEGRVWLFKSNCSQPDPCTVPMLHSEAGDKSNQCNSM